MPLLAHGDASSLLEAGLKESCECQAHVLVTSNLHLFSSTFSRQSTEIYTGQRTARQGQTNSLGACAVAKASVVL